jgi:signal peptidase I
MCRWSWPAASSILLMRAALALVRRNAALEIALIVALATGLAVSVQAYAVKPYSIPSGSMEPTLRWATR